jgi:hypothetical protein
MKPVTDLLAPVQGPPTQHAIPQLWERVRIMFKAIFIIIGNTVALATWRKVPHEIRSNLMPRLVPLEHIVRLLVTLEAITFLIMTPEGRRLLRETPKTPIPEPRVALLATKLSEEANADGEAMEKRPGALCFPSSNPAEWNAHFSVLRWRIPPAETDAESAAAPLAAEDICCEKLPPRLPTRDPARRLARRVEALSRVLADPGPRHRALRDLPR